MLSKYLKYKNIIDQIPPPLDPDECNLGSNSSHWYLTSKNNSDTYIIDDLFTSNQLAKILALGKIIKNERGQTQDQSDDYLQYRKTMVSWLNINSHTEWLYEIFTNAVSDANTHFDYELECIETLQFTIYNSLEEGLHDKHVDPLNWNLPTNRKLTFVLQLSDPSDYEGGDLLLWNSRNPRVMEKKLGRLLFFPSNILHEVTPVTKGIRYSLVGWVHGPAFK